MTPEKFAARVAAGRQTKHDPVPLNTAASGRTESEVVRVPGVSNQAVRGPWSANDGPIDASTIRPISPSPKEGRAVVGLTPGARSRTADRPGPQAGPGEAHALRDPMQHERQQAVASALKAEAVRGGHGPVKA
jgi:hypothetical protein